MIQISKSPTAQRFADVQREVALQFPKGRFVAVEGSVVVADAESHRQLVEKLASVGKSPKDMLIVQAGIEYPASAVIFSTALTNHRHA